MLKGTVHYVPVDDPMGQQNKISESRVCIGRCTYTANVHRDVCASWPLAFATRKASLQHFRT